MHQIWILALPILASAFSLLSAIVQNLETIALFIKINKSNTEFESRWYFIVAMAALTEAALYSDPSLVLISIIKDDSCFSKFFKLLTSSTFSE